VTPSTAIVTVWDRLVASDPGLSRLVLATRVTLAVVSAAAILSLCARALHAPIAIALFGGIVAMQASLAVNDAKPRTTAMLVPVPGIIGVTLGALFAAQGILADLMFLVVLFGAVAVRVRGPRWTALGTIAMMTYFIALLFGATLDELPSLIVAVVVGAACSFLTGFVILRDRPAWIARRTVGAFRARIRVVIACAQDVLEAPDRRRARVHLRAAVQRLNETATSIESRLGSEATAEIRIVFDAQLAAEDLAAAALRLRDADAPIPRAGRLALVALRRGRLARAARVARGAPQTDDVMAHALAIAIIDLCETIERVESTIGALALGDTPWAGPGAQQPALRQAVQVTIAAAAAIAVGEALSPQHWYWAVLATYFVFIGTASSGETLARAWSRIVGTAIGAAAGVLAGLLVHGDTGVAVALLFACLFLSVYLLRISHAMMIFFVTASLALLYIVLGRFSDGLLGMRLAETTIGALFGGVAGTLIFPTRTRDVIRERTRAALDAVGDVVRASVARLLDPQTDVDPLAAARLLEERVQQFIAGSRPAVSSPALLGSGHEMRRRIVLLRACSYYARTLARVADRAPSFPHRGVLAPLWNVDEGIATNVRAAAERLDAKGDAATVDTTALFEDLRRSIADDGESTTLRTTVHLLERIDRTVARLGCD